MQYNKKFPITIIGHCGFKKKYPENTLLSFEKAIDAGADYVELDVHLTSDYQMVVSHDGSTGRTGNIAYEIRTTPLETLKQVDYGQGQHIPTLQEVFDLCKGKIGIQIEIKHAGLAEKVVRLVEENEMVSDIAISSFVHSELPIVKKINSNILCAVLEPVSSNLLKAIFARNSFISDANKLGAEAIHPFYKYINQSFVKKAHAAGKIVVPWTTDKPQEWQKLIAAGVDGIITNDPEGLYQLLAK